MSRIGNRHLNIPENTSVTIADNVVTVKGPKGELSLNIPESVEVEVTDNVVITKPKNTENANIEQGTINSLINNMLIGVSKGFKVGLEAIGVGYRFNVQGNKIVVNAGFSHPVNVEIPAGIKAELTSNTEITLEGIDKQKLSEFAANIRKIRKPEPYKGKGIRYKDEHVRRKEGKKAA